MVPVHNYWSYTFTHGKNFNFITLFQIENQVYCFSRYLDSSGISVIRNLMILYSICKYITILKSQKLNLKNAETSDFDSHQLVPSQKIEKEISQKCLQQLGMRHIPENSILVRLRKT